MRSCLPGIRTASATLSDAAASTRLRTSGSTRLGSHSIAGLRRGAISTSWISISSRIASWATFSPSRISVSGTWMAPPSTMTMALAEPATTMSTSAYSSCVKVGFTTQLPWMRPIRTDATGVSKGITDVLSATEAPISVSTSASFSWSALSTWAWTWVSLKKPSGKSGRSVRSVSRAERISFSWGAPSRLKKPPGILPAA